MSRGLTSYSFSCAIISLQQTKDQINISGIRETLRRTPEDIDEEIVQDVLHTIKLQCEARATLARRLLALLTAAEEPMTAEAICHALGMSYVLEIEKFPLQLDNDLIPDVGVLVKCCKGLITIDPVTRLVTLQDDIAECLRRTRSARLSYNISKLYAKNDHFSHQEMAMLSTVSLAYLSMGIFEEGPCHQVAALRKRLDEHPFLEYAAQHWGYHARELLPDWYTGEMIHRLLRKAKNLESALQVRDLDADVVSLLEALQKGKEHDQALDATHIRSGISGLQVASGYGFTGIVCDMLRHNPATSFEPDSFGISAIHEAAQAGWDHIVDILIKVGANPISMDRNGKSPLYYATQNGCHTVISVLRKQMLDNYGELDPALFEAIVAGKADVVVRLLETMSQNTLRERSTIVLSIHAGHLNILEVLLAQGANPSCPDLLLSDQIPLHQAIRHGRADMAKLLLDRGADIHTRDDNERNAIFETVKAPNTDGLSLLLNRGIHMDCLDSEGNTVLHRAAVDGAVEQARLLIYQGMINKTTSNKEGLTPLHLAVRKKRFEIADMLLEFEEVDVNVKATAEAAGWTPLMYAVEAGSLKLCERLIKKGARAYAAGGKDLPMPFRLGEGGDHQEIIRLLCQNGAILRW